MIQLHTSLSLDGDSDDDGDDDDDDDDDDKHSWINWGFNAVVLKASFFDFSQMAYLYCVSFVDLSVNIII